MPQGLALLVVDQHTLIEAFVIALPMGCLHLFFEFVCSVVAESSVGTTDFWVVDFGCRIQCRHRQP